MTRTPLLEKARDLAAELAMVVLGILIAFALNSWWEGRETEQRRQAHLRALAGDFQENVRSLERAVTGELRTSDASARLLALAQRPGAIPSDTAFDLAGQVFSSFRFEAVMGAYEGVVASGGLTQLNDPALAARLARFAASLRNTYPLEFGERVYFDLIRDTRGRMGFLYRAIPLTSGGAPALEPAPPTQAELAALLRDPTVRDALALRALAQRDVGRAYGALEQQARDILARVQADLAKE